jgi:hypothetical protein
MATIFLVIPFDEAAISRAFSNLVTGPMLQS